MTGYTSSWGTDDDDDYGYEYKGFAFVDVAAWGMPVDIGVDEERVVVLHEDAVWGPGTFALSAVDLATAEVVTSPLAAMTGETSARLHVLEEGMLQTWSYTPDQSILRTWAWTAHEEPAILVEQMSFDGRVVRTLPDSALAQRIMVFEMDGGVQVRRFWE